MVKQVVWSNTVRDQIETGPSRFTARASLETHTAASITDLMDRVVRARADLVVLDLGSGEVPVGLACERLRSDKRTASIPIMVLAGEDADAALVRGLGCNEVIPNGIGARALQEKIAGALGMRLRRHPRYPVVLPVARGRIFHEFLGYSHEISEAGMGFHTIARIRGGDQLNLKIYRSTEEKPISVNGRVCGVRANIDTGIGYAVGVEFVRLAADDKQRLTELFPLDACVTWGTDAPSGEPSPDGVDRQDASVTGS